jgi:acyl-CoA thioesterase
MTEAEVAAQLHPFDDAVRLAPLGEGRFRGHTHEKYWNFVGPFGGITAATALNGLLQREERIGDPLSLTVNFMAPIKAGEFTVETRLVRSNRSTQHWSVQIVQEGEPVLGGLAVFAIRRETWRLREAVPPEASTPEDCKLFKARLGIAWPAMYEMRYARGKFGVENPDTVTHCWVSDAPRRQLDHAALTAICDAFFPRIFLRRPQMAPIATVSLNIYFHTDAADLAREGSEPVLCVAKAQVFNKGYYDQEGQVWGRDGVLLATTQQVAWYKE